MPSSPIRIVLPLSLLACVAAAGCHATVPATPRAADGVVVWMGELHKAVHDGDVDSKVQLAVLARDPHLYAVGPLEGLTGEITVLDGRPTISTVERGVFRSYASLDHGAAFLVWTHAANWKPGPLPESVRTLEQLEAFMPEAERAAGVDCSMPLAFRVEGGVEKLEYHILKPPEANPPSFEDHERAKVRSSLSGRMVCMLGFYSTEHRGVFTPANSDVHVHFVADDEQLAGHVDGFRLAPGAVLFLAVPSR